MPRRRNPSPPRSPEADGVRLMPPPVALAVPVGERQTTALLYTASGPRLGATLVLAHGAGAPQTHPFMVGFAEGLAARGLDVATFNFLYTEAKRRLPDRTDALERCYRAIVAGVATQGNWDGNRLFIGGKSMGGRMASHLAAAGDDLSGRIGGLVLLGYPLHPPGKPQTLRVAHLASISAPVLIVQGERDPFGSPLELAPHFGVTPASVTVHAVANADHSLAPPKRIGPPLDEVYAGVQDVIAAWVRRQG
ncbi:MAG: alpha/beta family hydrolase [Vicinamibacterales bacterium]